LLDFNNILIAGGNNGTTDLNTAIKYDAGALTPTVTPLSNMAQPRANFSGTLLNNTKVLIVGGVTGNVSAELFDPAGAGSFSLTGALPAGEDKRFHTATLLTGVSPNVGKVFISGGMTGAGAGSPSSTQFLYTASSGTIASAPALMTARSNHAAISLSNTNVLICGGTSTGTDTLKSCEVYDHGGGSGNQLSTGPMTEARKDFGLAPITISSIVEILAAGNGTVSTPMRFAETYNLN
jgi:hypothetical protein